MEVNNLRFFRKDQEMSVRELSVIADVSTATIVGIERYGLYPQAPLRGRLSKALGVSEGVIWPDAVEVSSDGR
jgi:transcriptional regulator with XRE-family HTH domain